MTSEFLNQLNKTREYLDYLEEHYNNVQKAWQLLQDKCKDMRFIYDRYVSSAIKNNIDLHDLSKLSENELVQYRKKFYQTENEKGYYYLLEEDYDAEKLLNTIKRKTTIIMKIGLMLVFIVIMIKRFFVSR